MPLVIIKYIDIIKLYVSEAFEIV